MTDIARSVEPPSYWSPAGNDGSRPHGPIRSVTIARDEYRTTQNRRLRREIGRRKAREAAPAPYSKRFAPALSP